MSTMVVKSALIDAPPTKNPSMSGLLISSLQFLSVTLPENIEIN